MSHDPDKTHFGYKTVDKKDKAGLVADVFDSVADKYDVMNDPFSGRLRKFLEKHDIRDRLKLTN